MADDSFRPATEGAGNEILKKVNEIYENLIGDEEAAHPHTLPEADEGDNKGIWLTEETARKIVESLRILAEKIDDRKDNTFTVNQNGASTEYNTYAAKSISVPVPSEAGEEGQALVTSAGGETSEWSNEIGGVTLKDGDISAEGITASGGIEAKGGITVSGGDLEVSNGAISASGKVTAGNGLEVTGDISADGDLEATDITASGVLDVTGKATLKNGLEVNGGAKTDDLTTNGMSVEKDANGEGGDVTVAGTLTVEDKATLNGGIETTDIEASGTIKGSFEGDLEGNAKTATTAGEAQKTQGVLTATVNGNSRTFNGSTDVPIGSVWAPTENGDTGEILRSLGGNQPPNWYSPFIDHSTGADISDFPVWYWSGNGKSPSLIKPGSGTTVNARFIQSGILQILCVKVVGSDFGTNQGAGFGVYVGANSLFGGNPVLTGFACSYNKDGYDTTSNDNACAFGLKIDKLTSSLQGKFEDDKGNKYNDTYALFTKVQNNTYGGSAKYGVHMTIIGIAGADTWSGDDVYVDFPIPNDWPTEYEYDGKDINLLREPSSDNQDRYTVTLEYSEDGESFGSETFTWTYVTVDNESYYTYVADKPGVYRFSFSPKSYTDSSSVSHKYTWSDIGTTEDRVNTITIIEAKTPDDPGGDG